MIATTALLIVSGFGHFSFAEMSVNKCHAAANYIHKSYINGKGEHSIEAECVPFDSKDIKKYIAEGYYSKDEIKPLIK